MGIGNWTIERANHAATGGTQVHTSICVGCCSLVLKLASDVSRKEQ